MLPFTANYRLLIVLFVILSFRDPVVLSF